MQVADVASINSTTQKYFGLVHASLMGSQQSPCGQSPEAFPSLLQLKYRETIHQSDKVTKSKRMP